MNTENIQATEPIITEEVVVAQPNAKEYEIDYLGQKEKVSLNFDNDDEVKQILQKAKNNDRLAEKWEQSKGTLSEMEEISRKLGYVDDNGHGDVKAMIDATKSNLTTAEINQIANEKSPDEIAEELYRLRQDNSELLTIKQERELEQKKQKDYMDFINTFEKINGKKFDDKTDLIPLEVWLEVEKGTPLKYAYSEYTAEKDAKERIIAQKNLENANASTGNIASAGNRGNATFTKEQVKGMSRAEVRKNFVDITNSMKNWNK